MQNEFPVHRNEAPDFYYHAYKLPYGENECDKDGCFHRQGITLEIENTVGLKLIVFVGTNAAEIYDVQEGKGIRFEA